MDRKAMAKETLAVMERGYYDPASGKRRINLKEDLKQSIAGSMLISPAEGVKILKKYGTYADCAQPETRVENISTVEAIRILAGEGKEDIGVLNFASAKNPGGGFLNGAKAQEESLAVSSTLYPTLTAHDAYYRENRAHRSMMYLDYGIYSPGVVFFRDEALRLAETPVKASVLTQPAVNIGQAILKGEDAAEARSVMRRRMRLALGIFAEQKARHLVLGAYGCGVFRNDPREIAVWWKELLQEGMGRYFASVFHAVLDHSKGKNCIRAFQEANFSGISFGYNNQHSSQPTQEEI